MATFAGRWVLCCLLVAVFSVLATGCSERGSAEPEIGRTEQAVIYGDPSLLEERDAPSDLQALVPRVGIMVSRSALTNCNASTCELATRLGDPFCAGHDIMAGTASTTGQRAADTQNACSAFLIAPNLFATAGHCINPEPQGDVLDCSNRSMVMRFRVTSNQPDNNSNTVMQLGQIAHCVEVVAHGGVRARDPLRSAGNDWAVFRVDRTFTDRQPFELSADRFPEAGTPLLGIHHPDGLPVKIDPQAQVLKRPEPAGWFEFSGDARGGSSGGPLIDPESNAVVGIIVGSGDFTDDQRANIATDPTISNVDPSSGKVTPTWDISDTANGCKRSTRCNPGALDCNGWRASFIRNLLDSSTVPKEDIQQVAKGDFDHDQLTDFAHLSANADGFDIDISLSTQSPGFQSFANQFDFAENSTGQLCAADLNEDDIDDLVALVNGEIVYLDGRDGSTMTRNANLVLRDTAHERCIIEEATGSEPTKLLLHHNPTDIYYAGPGGLTTGFRLTGFPTLNERDGRYINVSGQGFSSIDIPDMDLEITADGAESAFHVDIFDGDINSGRVNADWGRDPGVTCFKLIADGDMNGDGPVVAQAPSDTFADQRWQTLYSGPHSNDARTFSAQGNYHYVLRALNAASCASTAADPTIAIVNAFKVRTSGDVYLPSLDASVIAADSYGFSVSPIASQRNTADTAYDGTFRFLIDGAIAGTEIILQDADADFRNDQDGPDGAVPGRADGANDLIGYTLFDPEGRSALVNNDVSGNYDVTRGETEIESTAPIATGGQAGLWSWEWHDVWTENNVHVWAPFASPATYRMYGGDSVPRLFKVSSATSHAKWLLDPLEIVHHLPIVLGKRDRCGLPFGSSVFVDSLLEAKKILAGLGPISVSISSTPAYNKLLSRALAAKLNVSRATKIGEKLGPALVYGTTQPVSGVLADTDTAVANRCRGHFCIVGDTDPCSLLRHLPSGATRKETGFERLQLLSEAVNEADVSHRGIVTAPPPSQPPPTTTPDQGPM